MSFQDHAGVFQFSEHGEEMLHLSLLFREAQSLPADELEMYTQNLWDDEKE